MADADKDLATYDISGLKLGKGDAVRPVGLHDLMTYTPSGFPGAAGHLRHSREAAEDSLGHGRERHPG